eukprot:2444557-Pyramimonas_sp.AAC.1
MGLPGGFLLGSVYMESASECVAANLQRYCRLSEYLRLFGLPFLLGGDWNCSPLDVVTSGLADILTGVP